MAVKFPDEGTVRRDIVDFLQRHKHLLNGTVLQVGSKRLFEAGWWANQLEMLAYQEASWYGVDLEDGPGVDRAMDFCAEEIPELMTCGFGGAILTEVLEHAYDPQQMLKNTFKALQPGGWALVTTPFVAHIHNHPNDYWRFTPEGLRLLLEKAGFVDVEVEGSPGFIEVTTCQYDITKPSTHKIAKGTHGLGRKPNV